MTRREALRLAAGALGVLAAGRAAPGWAGTRAESEAIRVDQLGYRPRDPKLALVAGAPATFAVREAASHRIVFEGAAGPPAPVDPASGDRVAALDFTPLTTPGEYVVTAPAVEPSPVFPVGEAVYRGALRAVLRVFHYHRCGPVVRDGSPWGHLACHLADAREWGSGTPRDVTGGWHDAGDYGKYVPSAGFALWHLAAAHERARDAGLRDDMRWELDWLLRMQGGDGGVFHKVGPAKWTGDRAPEQDRDPRFFFQVTSAATATLAAAAARSARLFQPVDAGYAARLVAAAESAWGWLERHPAIVPSGGFRNPPGVEGGEYEDDDDRDQRFWAAAELWRATGDARYRASVLAVLDRWAPFDYPASWARVQNLAFLGLVDPGSPLPGAPRVRLGEALVERSSAIVDSTGRGGYRVALSEDDYYWGSNGLALARAVQLLAAFRHTGRPAYRHAALDQVHYLFGRNALGKSFVTGFGADPVRRPYHQPSLGHPARLVMPGLLAAGPNSGEEGVPGTRPARAYRDDDRLYGVNEPSIYWNALLARVLTELDVLP